MCGAWGVHVQIGWWEFPQCHITRHTAVSSAHPSGYGRSSTSTPVDGRLFWSTRCCCVHGRHLPACCLHWLVPSDLNLFCRGWPGSQRCAVVQTAQPGLSAGPISAFTVFQFSIPRPCIFHLFAHTSPTQCQPAGIGTAMVYAKAPPLWFCTFARAYANCLYA